MKSKFSVSWKRSVQPRKQRKFLANAPLHIRRKFLSATLDKPLRLKNLRRSVRIRRNDEVKVMRGKYHGKLGKILEIDLKNSRVKIDGINITRKDGEKVAIWFHPSNLKIIRLDDSDRRRFKQKLKEEKKEIKEILKKEEKEIKKKENKEK